MREAVHIQKAVLERLNQLSLAQQQQVLEFVTALQQEENLVPPLKLSLQQVAALPLAERDALLAPYITLMAEDFRSDPELTEFSVLDGEDWDLEDE